MCTGYWTQHGRQIHTNAAGRTDGSHGTDGETFIASAQGVPGILYSRKVCNIHVILGLLDISFLT